MLNTPKHVEVSNNGIVFYSNHVSSGIHSYISEDGTIQTEKTYKHFEQFSKRSKLIRVFFAVVIVVISCISIFSSHNSNLATMSLAFLAFAANNFFLLCEYFFHSHISKRSRKKRQFYAAKNILFNAYEMLEGIPNLWELQKVSMYAYDLDLYTKIFQTFHGLLLSMFFFFFKYSSFFKAIGFYIVAYIIATIISIILNKTKIFLYLECLFLAEPNDIQLETVIKNLEAWIESEKKFV